MGLAATLARRSLLQRPGRTLFSILGIAVGIATVVGIFTLDHNTLILRAHSDDPDWQAEIQVSPSEGVKNPREELQHVVGVSDVSSVFQSQASLWPDGGEPRGTYFVGLEPAHARALGKYSLLDGRFTQPLPPRTASGLVTERHIAVKVTGGDANTKLVSYVTPRRRWPF